MASPPPLRIKDGAAVHWWLFPRHPSRTPPPPQILWRGGELSTLRVESLHESCRTGEDKIGGVLVWWVVSVVWKFGPAVEKELRAESEKKGKIVEEVGPAVETELRTEKETSTQEGE